MSDKKQETIADIIAWLRRPRKGENVFLAVWIDEIADRLEAAHKRELSKNTSKNGADFGQLGDCAKLREAHTADPDWKEICARCRDGDIEPEHCEYYGEPNGCNSPIYGEHPTTEKFSVVGDCAKLREALVQCELFLGYVSRHGHPTLNPGDKCTACSDADKLREMVVRALSAPPRNCDVGTAEEQEVRFRNYCWNHSSRDKNMECQCPIDAEGKAGCKLTWAQMPYEEGGDK